ncbi:hypothetical protein [Spirosoma pulveris]
MQTFDQFKEQFDGDLIAMFQVEELEERLENQWELSASGNSDGTVTATATLKI